MRISLYPVIENVVFRKWPECVLKILSARIPNTINGLVSLTESNTLPLKHLFLMFSFLESSVIKFVGDPAKPQTFSIFPSLFRQIGFNFSLFHFSKLIFCKRSDTTNFYINFGDLLAKIRDRGSKNSKCHNIMICNSNILRKQIKRPVFECSNATRESHLFLDFLCKH